MRENIYRDIQSKQKSGVRSLETVQPDFPEYEDLFHISWLFEDNCSERKAYNCNLKINGVETTMEIDTGAAVSIMNYNKFQKLCHPKVKPILEKARVNLRTYSGEIINPKGVAPVKVAMEIKRKISN